ncbi:hypothetical protein IMZ48_06735 [Candidatus Bathyarchaeota archaeon]|nr:hypothetical protein [Candidatus Bathyarchaeota archaeon]
MVGNCDLELLGDSQKCTYSHKGADGMETLGYDNDGLITSWTTVTVTAGAEKLTTPTETSGDEPKETGANEEDEDDENGAAGLARGSLLAAAVAAVGAALF